MPRQKAATLPTLPEHPPEPPIDELAHGLARLLASGGKRGRRGPGGRGRAPSLPNVAKSITKAPGVQHAQQIQRQRKAAQVTSQAQAQTPAARAQQRERTAEAVIQTAKATHELGKRNPVRPRAPAAKPKPAPAPATKPLTPTAPLTPTPEATPEPTAPTQSGHKAGESGFLSGVASYRSPVTERRLRQGIPVQFEQFYGNEPKKRSRKKPEGGSEPGGPIIERSRKTGAGGRFKRGRAATDAEATPEPSQPKGPRAGHLLKRQWVEVPGGMRPAPAPEPTQETAASAGMPAAPQPQRSKRTEELRGKLGGVLINFHRWAGTQRKEDAQSLIEALDEAAGKQARKNKREARQAAREAAREAEGKRIRQKMQRGEPLTEKELQWLEGKTPGKKGKPTAADIPPHPSAESTRALMKDIERSE